MAEAPALPHRPVARRASSTSVGRARRCSTGPSPGGSAGASCCASRTPTRPATGRSGRRGSSTPSPGSASAPTTRCSRGRTSRAPTPTPTCGRGQRLFEARPRLLLRPHARADPGARQGVGQAGLRRLLARPWARARARPGAALPRADGADGRRRRRPRRGRRSTTPAIEDFVLLRGNGTPVFLLANVVDDIEMRITHVVRAEEHLPNTPKQQMLWEALGHEPPVWAHVPVLVNEQRKKLSKRRDKVALEQYRDEGYLADAMVNYLMTLGWAPRGDTEIVPWAQIEAGVPARGRHPLAGVLRPQEARRVQRRVHPGAVGRRLRRGLRAVDPRPTATATAFAAIAPLVQTRVVTLAEAPPMVDFLFLDEPVDRRRGVGQGDGAAVGGRAARPSDRRLRRRRRGRRGVEGRRGGRIADALGAKLKWPRRRCASPSPAGPSVRRCSSRWSCSAGRRRWAAAGGAGPGDAA